MVGVQSAEKPPKKTRHFEIAHPFFRPFLERKGSAKAPLFSALLFKSYRPALIRVIQYKATKQCVRCKRRFVAIRSKKAFKKEDFMTITQSITAEKRHFESKESPLLTLRQFCSTFSWPSESAMRAYIFKAAEFGIQDAFIRVNRRVLIDPNKFFSLIRQFEQVKNNRSSGKSGGRDGLSA